MLEGFDAESYRLSDTRLALSWLQPQGQQLLAASAVLTLEITAPQGGKISELLRFSELGIVPEIYSSDGGIHPLQLAWLTPSSTYFISPNPAHGSFALQSNAERREDCLVQMLDVQGKIVFERSFTSIQGMNRWEIETGRQSAGLYFLKVNGEATGKIIIQ